MFLPFLPLILASAGLTLFSGELERTEPWLNLPLAVNLSLIILFSFPSGANASMAPAI